MTNPGSAGEQCRPGVEPSPRISLAVFLLVLRGTSGNGNGGNGEKKKDVHGGESLATASIQHTPRPSSKAILRGSF